MFDLLDWEGPLEKEMAIPVFLPGKSHGQRSLAGCSIWGHRELDMTWRLNGSRNMIYILRM